jgi:uncharacterized integral membrane protein
MESKSPGEFATRGRLSGRCRTAPCGELAVGEWECECEAMAQVTVLGIKWPPRWADFVAFCKTAAKFTLAPLFALAHAVVFWQNPDTVPVRALWWQDELPVSFLLFNATLYGVFLATVLLYWRQYLLTDDIAKLREELDIKDSLLKTMEADYKKLRAAASQVIIPCNLDKLVEKGFQDASAHYSAAYLHPMPWPR